MAPVPNVTQFATAAADDVALFIAVDTEINAASVCSRKGRLKQAATMLRRAFDIASERLGGAGTLAAHVARASIGVQYCALLSRFGRHSEALDEALAAAVETEEVWQSLLSADEALACLRTTGELPSRFGDDVPFSLLMRDPPRWLERAAIASVQARHCVALELEYTMQDPVVVQDPEFNSEARRDMIAALHREGAWLAAKLLAANKSIRDLSYRAETQAARRREEARAGKQSPSDASQPECKFWEDGAPRDCLPFPGDTFWEEDGAAEARGDKAAAPVRTQSASSITRRAKENCRPASAPGFSIPQGSQAGVKSAAALQECYTGGDMQQQRADAAVANRRPLSSPAERISRPRTANHQGHRGRPSTAGHQRESGKPERNDIFAEWLQTQGLGRAAEVRKRLASGDGAFRDLHEDMKRESYHYKNKILPGFTPEQIYENSKVFSPYGQHVCRQSERRDEVLQQRRRIENDRPGSAPVLPAPRPSSHVAKAPDRLMVPEQLQLPTRLVGVSRPSSAAVPDSSPTQRSGSRPSSCSGNSRPASAAGRAQRSSVASSSGTPANADARERLRVADIRELHKVLQRSFVTAGVQCGFLGEDQLALLAEKKRRNKKMVMLDQGASLLQAGFGGLAKKAQHQQDEGQPEGQQRGASKRGASKVLEELGLDKDIGQAFAHSKEAQHGLDTAKR